MEGGGGELPKLEATGVVVCLEHVEVFFSICDSLKRMSFKPKKEEGRKT